MSQDPSHLLASMSSITFAIVALLIALGSVVLTVVIYWRIFAKAGYSGWMGLLMFVPIANFIALCILAFGEWPIYEELYRLRHQANMAGRQPTP